MVCLKKICYNTVLIFLIIVFTVFQAPAGIKCQQRFLLTEREMEEYDLVRQGEDQWSIGEDLQTKDVISQKWHIKGSHPSQYIYIDYCEFNTIPEAINGTSYAAQSNAAIYIWGSFYGSIVGEMSWVDNGGSNALYFVRGNVGTMIFKPHRNTEDDKQRLNDIANRILNKIEHNLSTEIVLSENISKQKQVPISSYRLMTDPVIQSKLMNGFSLHKAYDSKWVFGSNDFTCGIRKEWINGQGSIISIDICMFDDSNSAIDAADKQDGMIHRFSDDVVTLGDFNSLQSLIESWQNEWRGGFPKKLFSVVGVKDNIVLHLYQFDPNGIDTEFISDLVEQLSEDIVNF